MRQNHLREVLRDVDVACAITAVVRKNHLTAAATTELLKQLQVPRASSVANLVEQTP